MTNKTVTLSREPEIQRWSANWHMEEFYKSPHGNHVTYRDHRAHVTRLQAEVERLKDEAGIYRTGYALLKEELTKARELLVRAETWMPEESQVLTDIQEYLAHQSAPAAKDGDPSCNNEREDCGLPTDHECRACGRGPCIDR
ncbi:hypothetical protein [Pseudomonas sp. ZS001]|uniref:hypothetical protein n=1 Tax=Pseudomonas sp. ZS001 TaxID=3138070 RepID=UPI0031389409